MKGPFGSPGLRRGVVAMTMFTTMFALLGTGAAQAAVTTHVSAAYSASGGNFHGKVRSGNAECVPHRTVKLFKRTSSGRVLEGKTTSKTHGGWSVDAMHAHGKYFAVVPAATVMGVSCGRAKSSIVDVM